jgi:hypothetical protein
MDNFKETIIYNPNGSLEGLWGDLYPILNHFNIQWCDGGRTPIHRFPYSYDAISIDEENRMATSSLAHYRCFRVNRHDKGVLLYKDYKFIDINDIINTKLDKAIDCFLYGDT